MDEPVTKDKSLEAWIWDAACSIRGAKDAAKYKDYILPLIFTKRLCDVFDDEVNRIAEEIGRPSSSSSPTINLSAFISPLNRITRSSRPGRSSVNYRTR